jgi:hypothetical protein
MVRRKKPSFVSTRTSSSSLVYFFLPSLLGNYWTEAFIRDPTLTVMDFNEIFKGFKNDVEVDLIDGRKVLIIKEGLGESSEAIGESGRLIDSK